MGGGIRRSEVVRGSSPQEGHLHGVDGVDGVGGGQQISCTPGLSLPLCGQCGRIHADHRQLSHQMNLSFPAAPSPAENYCYQFSGLPCVARHHRGGRVQGRDAAPPQGAQERNG